MMAVENTQFGQMIRRFRVAAALSQEALAERSGVSARAVSDLERGLRSAPRLETVRMLADALSLSVTERAMLLSASRPETVQPPAPRDSSGRFGLTVVPMRLQTLPVPPTRLIGRELIVEQVTGLLSRDDGRLVTLVGPGGVGKTRLAIAVASALSDGDGQDAVFVDLSPVTEPGLALAAVAAALGLRELGERPLQETLADFLRARSVLLLLDNAEHLLQFAPALSVLLQQCPSLKLLVTSRQPLRLRGEHEVHVDPLPVPEPGMVASVEAVARIEAVRLFVDRARDVRPDFELTESNVADVAEVCRRLDGLPLAIELAAPRIRLLGLPELRERLQSQLGLLTGGARDAPDRQQTLRAAIAWSYDLLSLAEQRFFCRLAVFAGGFTLESAKAVAGDGDNDAFELVSSLLEQSLLQAVLAADSAPRFRMLVSIREFGLEQLLRRGEETETRQRHFDYFLSLTESMALEMRERHSDPHWYVHALERVDFDLDNLRAAWRWSEERGDSVGALRIITNVRMYWVARPFGNEVLSEVEKLLRTAQGVPAEVRARAEITSGTMAAWLGDFDDGFAHSQRALAMAHETGDALVIGSAQVLPGVLWEVTGDCQRSAEAYREAAATLRSESDSYLLGVVLGELGDRLLLCGDIDEGIQLIEEALEHSRSLGYRFEVGVSLGQRAHAARLQGDLAGASRLFWESIGEAGAIGDERRVLGAFIGLAGVALDEGQPERAARLIGATEAARESRGVSRIIAHPLHNARIYAAVQERLGDDEYAKLVAEGRTIPFDQVLAGSLGPLRSDSG
jgi:predicted ATPase/transcriptional regulator with XRE-family HTH domain